MKMFQDRKCSRLKINEDILHMSDPYQSTMTKLPKKNKKFPIIETSIIILNYTSEDIDTDDLEEDKEYSETDKCECEIEDL